MKLSDQEIVKVSLNLSNSLYYKNIEATRQLCEMIEKIKPRLKDSTEPNDYVKSYDDDMYTYQTWDELIQSEIDQGDYGLTPTECREEMNHSIWMLPCGWFVQRV